MRTLAFIPFSHILADYIVRNGLHILNCVPHKPHAVAPSGPILFFFLDLSTTQNRWSNSNHIHFHFQIVMSLLI